MPAKRPTQTDSLIAKLEELIRALAPLNEMAALWVARERARHADRMEDDAWQTLHAELEETRDRIVMKVLAALGSVLNPKGSDERAATEKIAERLVPEIKKQWSRSLNDPPVFDAADAERIAMEDIQLGGWKSFNLGKRLTPALEAMQARLDAGKPRADT